MPKVQDVLAYTRKLAEQLESDAHGGQFEEGKAPTALARVSGALEFFRLYAGEESHWATRAVTISQSRASDPFKVRYMATHLQEWADQVDAGIVEIVGSRAWEEVAVVSTDVMDQVRRLLEDKAVHPAAPIVLCGAALEIALRALADARGVTVPVPSSMAKLTDALRQAGILTAQDVKDLTACGGIRNSAAHGDFASLNAARAGLMEQHTNLLLRRLADLHP